jgi:hypothetical protein
MPRAAAKICPHFLFEEDDKAICQQLPASSSQDSRLDCWFCSGDAVILWYATSRVVCSVFHQTPCSVFHQTPFLNLITSILFEPRTKHEASIPYRRWG